MDRKKGIRYGRDSGGGEAFYIDRRNGQNFPQKEGKEEKTRRCEDAWEGS